VAVKGYDRTSYFIHIKNKERGLKNLLIVKMDEKKEGWKQYEGKRVFLKLKNNREYSGKILSVEDKGSCSIIIILDKFDKKVGFYDSEISVIEEERE